MQARVVKVVVLACKPRRNEVCCKRKVVLSDLAGKGYSDTFICQGPSIHHRSQNSLPTQQSLFTPFPQLETVTRRINATVRVFIDGTEIKWPGSEVDKASDRAKMKCCLPPCSSAFVRDKDRSGRCPCQGQSYGGDEHTRT